MGHPDQMEHLDVPYLVVGAGPVGLTAAALLAQRGQRCVIVERRDGPLRHPAAHAVNARTLEIFRQCGLDMDTILGAATDPADAGHVNFLTRLDGELIGRLPYERQGPDCERFTPTPLRNISQHRLEPILSDAVMAAPEVDLRYSTEWRSSEQDADGVTSTVVDLHSGAAIRVRSRYLIAADGAGSRIRKSLGIEMEGPPQLESFVAVHFGADLRPVVEGRPGVLHFVLDPAVEGVFVAHDMDGDWVFMTSFDPELEGVDDYDSHRAVQMVRDAVGRDDLEVDIRSIGTWHMSAQVAERLREGPIFLVGDAAHRFPPTGGLGLNTGVGDVHGLVWKLCAAEAGWAGSSLLDSHDSERRPVAKNNCDVSMANAFRLVMLLEALGITDGATTADMHARLADPESRGAIDAAVAEQAPHFDLLGLQLGYVYSEGALLRDGDPPPAAQPSTTFDPHAFVGGRLPHGRLGDRRSTLDLVSPEMLTLFTFGDHEAWAGAIAALEAPVAHVRIGVDAAVPAGWVQTCGARPGEAFLVRPDQHLAWRSGETEPGACKLDRVVTQVLGRTGATVVEAPS